MKKTVSVLGLLILVSYTMAALAANPLYVYQSTGKIDAFYTCDIDSIVMSKIDVDSTLCNDYVVQEFHVLDSIYRIPIEQIDSVSFVTPETVYQSNVVPLEGEIRSYIVKADELNLYLRGDTPSSICPKVGQKIVSTIGDEYLESAFMGEISSISSEDGCIVLSCEPVYMTDIFEVYYGIVNEERQQSPSLTNKAYPEPKKFSPGPFELNLFDNTRPEIFNNFTYDSNDNLAFNLPVNEAKAALTLTPTFDIRSFAIINPRYDLYISTTVVGIWTFDESFYLGGKIGLGFEFELFDFPVPIPEALVDLYLSGGIFADASLDFSAEYNAQQVYKSVNHFTVCKSGQEAVKDVNTIFPTERSYNGTFSLNGEIFLGAYLELGVRFICSKNLDIANVDAKLKAGPKISGTYIATKADAETSTKTTFLYDQLKKAEFSVDLATSLDFEANFFKWAWSTNIPWKPANKTWNLYSLRAVPLFKDTEFLSDSYPFMGKTTAYGNTMDTFVGLAAKSIDGASMNINYCSPYNEITKDENGELKISTYFEDADPDKAYILHPVIRYMGMDLLADPYVDNIAVDLGLSVRWASLNVGATKSSDYGFYFAWGETQTKSCYLESNCKYNKVYPSTLRSQGIIDSNGNLTAKYDAANSYFGGNWRTPTLNEFKELKNTCEWRITIMDGHIGFKVTGPNGNSIFIPLSGRYNGCELEYLNSLCFLWSSTVLSDHNSSYGLTADDDPVDFGPAWDYYPRYEGFCIRPVIE